MPAPSSHALKSSLASPPTSWLLVVVGLLLLGVAGCLERQSGPAAGTNPTPPEETAREGDNPSEEKSAMMSSSESKKKTEIATLGAGCFWCIEAVLEQIEGIEDVVSGYMGGTPETANYEMVCSGLTGHAEVVQVTFDPSVISYAEVLGHFWKLHDPTTLNRQGNDVGPQYRSVIFTHSEAQAEIAEKSLKAAQPAFGDPIVTQITPATEFHVAEKKHQDYYRLNKSQGYCRFVIAPKLRKLGLED